MANIQDKSLKVHQAADRLVESYPEGHASRQAAERFRDEVFALSADEQARLFDIITENEKQPA